VIADSPSRADAEAVHQEGARQQALLASPRIIICVPCGSTQVERRAIRESAIGAGAGQVYLIEEPMAAAIGADLPVADATGSMVSTSAAAHGSRRDLARRHGVLGLGARRRRQVRRGDHNYIRRNYGMLIGETTAELIKRRSAPPSPAAKCARWK